MHGTLRSDDFLDGVNQIGIGDFMQLAPSERDFWGRRFIGRRAVISFGRRVFALDFGRARFDFGGRRRVVLAVAGGGWRRGGVLGGYGRRAQDGLFHLVHLALRVGEVVRTPDAMQTPAQALQHLIAQAVAVARPSRAVVRRAVKLHAQRVASAPVRIHNRNVYEPAAGRHFFMDFVAALAYRIRQRLLERRAEIPPRFARRVGGHDAGFGVLEKSLERGDSARLRSVERDVLGLQVGEHLAAPPRPRNQHVQPPMPAFVVQRPESHGHSARPIAPVAHADEDDVALVPLHVFEILHEKRLVRMRVEKPLFGRVLAAQNFQLVLNRLRLPRAERRGAKRHVRRHFGVFHDCFGDRFRLVAVAAVFVNRFGKMAKAQAGLVAVEVRAGEHHQIAAVKLAVGQRD